MAKLANIVWASILLLTIVGCETNNQPGTGCMTDSDCPSPATCLGTQCVIKTGCARNSDCPQNAVCINQLCIVDPFRVPDMATDQAMVTVDLAPPPDLRQVPDLFGQCKKGEKFCVNKCIPESGCCTNIDCFANNQTCQVDNTCQCPVGQRVCGLSCTPNVMCCTNDDCPSKVCTNGACANPTCTDGVANGNETDIDCGGGFCNKCLVGRGCGIAFDCRSNVCGMNRCTQTGFQPSATYGGALAPSWVTAADLNVDTRMDVLVASPSSNTVSALIGRGDGTFIPITSTTVGLTPQFLAVGDLNGDTIPDAVTANNGSYDVSVLIGNGDGSFKTAQSYITGGSPIFVTINDINLDKRPDLLVANLVAHTVSILIGKGDGTFFGANSLPTVQTGPRWIAVGDYNGDKLPDIASLQSNTIPYTAAIFLAKSQSPGSFNLPTFTTITVSNPRNLVAADYNGDGRTDLAVGTASAGVQVLNGVGNGSFVIAGIVPGNVNTPFMHTLDINDDKKLDLLHSNGVMLGNGNGSFQPNVLIPGYSSVTSIAYGDFNGDMKTDIVFPSGNNIISLWGNQNGTFQTLSAVMGMISGSTTDITFYQPRNVTISDINGDGRGDVLVPGANASVNVFTANANGTLQLPVSYKVGNNAPIAVGTGDFDGDGKVDIVASHISESNIYILLNYGNGTFKPAVAVGSTTSYGIYTGDFNGDMKTDILNVSTSSTVQYLMGNGDGTFKPPLSISTNIFSIRAAMLLDFNNDTFLDFAVAGISNSAVGIVTGKGDGTFNAVTSITLAPNTIRPTGLGIADLNGDMQLDIIVSDNSTTNVWTSLNMGNNMFAMAKSYPIAAIASHGLMADFNGDGQMDFATSNSGDRSVSMLRGKGDGSMLDVINIDASPTPYYLSIGDINGDKKPDIATNNQGANNISVILNAF